MNIGLIYAAAHPEGNSARIAMEIESALSPDITHFNILDDPDMSLFSTFDLYIFVVPTYGDQELNRNFEDFILQDGIDFTGKKFTV